MLGIESSCDETAAAVIEDGRRLLSSVVNSQIDIHAAYGGVVPEVAARSHIEVVNPVIAEALAAARCTWDDIDAIAVTYAPGLVGSLLVGTLAARTLAILHDKPLYAVHHVEAHVYANFIVEDKREELIPLTTSGSVASPDATPLAATRAGGSVVEPLGSAVATELSSEAPTKSSETSTTRGSTGAYSIEARREAVFEDSGGGGATESAGDDGSGNKKKLGTLVLPSAQPTFPMLALIVSGGHSQLVLFSNHGRYELLGQTQDDAVGEAFDKVAKIIGLPYPGGPSIAKAALQGDPRRFKLPKAKLAGKYDFSFSGLKTAVLRAVQKEVGVDFTYPSHELPKLVDERLRNDFAASFQRTAIETLVDKTEAAYRDYQPNSVVIAGGVAANEELRRQLSARLPLAIEYAPMQFCTDNAAMIATLGYYQATLGQPVSPYELEVVPSLSMTASHWRK